MMIMLMVMVVVVVSERLLYQTSIMDLRDLMTAKNWMLNVILLLSQLLLEIIGHNLLKRLDGSFAVGFFPLL